jgi:hypothetical protein
MHRGLGEGGKEESDERGEWEEKWVLDTTSCFVCGRRER